MNKYDDLLREYKQFIIQIYLYYVEYLRHMASYDAIDADNDAELSHVNNAFNSYIFLLGLSLYRLGASDDHILNMMNMYTACSILSRPFRDDQSQDVVDVFYPMVQIKMQLDEKWRTRGSYVNAVDHNDGETSLTPEPLAMIRIAFCINACCDMKSCRIDDEINRILRRYYLADSRICDIAVSCGISLNVLNHYSRNIVRLLIDVHPEYKGYFAELENGNVICDNGIYVDMSGRRMQSFFTPFYRTSNDKITYARLCELQEKFEKVLTRPSQS